MTKASVENFAEYEQLAGGAQKIFNEMDPSVFLNDAQNAYVSLGLSANQYLAVINDVGATFAATMGDEAGYNAAKTGLQAISDYASGTGKNIDELSQKFTLITRSTSSYQSIADQFSGILPATSAQFLEQAQAAGLLSESYTKLTDVPIAEYQKAVSEMLEIGVKDLGLFGNTQAEAFDTLSGSLSMAKASWSNLLTGMSDDTADMDKLIKNFVTSVGAVGKNLLPKVKTALESAGELVEEIFPEIMAMIPELIDETLPELLDSAISIIETLVEGLAENGEQLGQSAVDLITKLATGLIDNLPQVIEAGMQILLGIVQGLADNAPTLINNVIALIPKIVSALTSADSLNQIISSGLDLVGALVDGLLDAIPQLLQAALDLVLGLVDYLLNPENTTTIKNAAGDIVTKIGEGLVAFVNNISQSITDFAEKVKEKFSNVDWKTIGKNIVDGIKNGISNAWNTFISFVTGKSSEIFSAFNGGSWSSIGSNIVSGIQSGVIGSWASLEGLIQQKASALAGAAASVLGIASPSKVFARIGRFMVEGLGVGWNDEIDSVTEDITKSLDFSSYKIPTLTASVSTSDSFGQSGSPMFGGVTVIQNIYAQEMTAAELMQEARYRAEQAVIFGV